MERISGVTAEEYGEMKIATINVEHMLDACVSRPTFCRLLGVSADEHDQSNRYDGNRNEQKAFRQW